MLRNRPPGSVRKRGHAEVRQFAPFELRRPFDQSLGGLVDSKPKPLFPKPPVVLCCRGHGHLQLYMYVDWTNFSRERIGREAGPSFSHHRVYCRGWSMSATSYSIGLLKRHARFMTVLKSLSPSRITHPCRRHALP